MINYSLIVGVRWRCALCGIKQEPVENEEWPQHCGFGMKLSPWYQVLPELND